MNKITKISFIVLVSLAVGGCAATLNIKEAPSVYSMPLQQGAPKIVIGDLEDRRPDKSNVGIVGALTLKTKKDINVLLTDRIAIRLRNEGFNIQKVNTTSGASSKNEIEIICDKARYGKVGTYVMGFNGSKCKFYGSSEEAKREIFALKNQNKTVIESKRGMQNVFSDF